MRSRAQRNISFEYVNVPDLEISVKSKGLIKGFNNLELNAIITFNQIIFRDKLWTWQDLTNKIKRKYSLQFMKALPYTLKAKIGETKLETFNDESDSESDNDDSHSVITYHHSESTHLTEFDEMKSQISGHTFRTVSHQSDFSTVQSTIVPDSHGSLENLSTISSHKDSIITKSSRKISKYIKNFK